MKKLICLICLIGPMFLSGCATAPLQPKSPAAALGIDLATDAAQAVQAYVEFQSGNTDMTWALAKGFTAYQDFIKSGDDVKAITKAWTGNTAESQKLADRLARIFSQAQGTPAQKIAALQQTVASVASDHGP